MQSSVSKDTLSRQTPKNILFMKIIVTKLMDGYPDVNDQWHEEAIFK
jgi:hypothetical protein